MDSRQHQGGEGIKEMDREDGKAALTTGSGEDMGAGVRDDQEGGTTGASSMTGGETGGARSPDARESSAAADAVRPGGNRGSNADGDMGAIGMSSAEPGPMGKGGGDEAGSFGGGGGGSQDSSYSGGGNFTGADSPAGENAQLNAGGQGQGDDLADRLGGEPRGAGMTGGGAVSGDRSPGRSEVDANRAGAAGYVPDPGSPGGMGGKAPGGVSPVQKDGG